MNLYKIFLICPYLSGSDDEVLCRAASRLIRNIGGLDLDICMSRHYELCYVYCAKLHEMIEAGGMAGRAGEKTRREELQEKSLRSRDREDRERTVDMKCPLLTKWLTYVCKAREVPYFPSDFQLEEYCRKKEHGKCPFFHCSLADGSSEGCISLIHAKNLTSA